MTVSVRTCFQPTALLEVDEQEAATLDHQGLLWAGTDEELAALHAAAGLPIPKAAPKTVPPTDSMKGP